MRMRPRIVAIACLAMLCATAASPSAAPSGDDAVRLPSTHAVVRAGDGTRLSVDVIDVDDPARVDMLRRWVEEATRATRLPSGRFPLDAATVEVREIASRDPSPVPWGQIARRDRVSVQLYVRADATFEQLRADWTAVHEFAHLAHPYLGERGRWMAEGLASYHQELLRARAGLLSPEEAWRRLDAGFRRGEATSAGTALGEIGRRRGGTMRVYWAGAAYWLDMDVVLRRDHGTTLMHVLDRYAQCCLDGLAQVEPESFAGDLDRIAGTDLFARRFRDYASMRSFPSLASSYRALGIEREDDGLRFADDPVARRLRDAMTAPQPAE